MKDLGRLSGNRKMNGCERRGQKLLIFPKHNWQIPFFFRVHARSFQPKELSHDALGFSGTLFVSLPCREREPEYQATEDRWPNQRMRIIWSVACPLLRVLLLLARITRPPTTYKTGSLNVVLQHNIFQPNHDSKASILIIKPVCIP